MSLLKKKNLRLLLARCLFSRVPLFAHSPEQLLGHRDSQRESLTLLDAKELLKYFTPEGLPVGELQPLQVPKRYEHLKATNTKLTADGGGCKQGWNGRHRMA